MKIDYVTWVAMIIVLAGLFWNVNTGFNRLHERIDRSQAETNGRFDALQAESNQRFEAVNARFDQMFDRMQAETNRRFDALLETIMGFDRWVSRNEGQIEVIREQLQAEGAP